MSKDIKKWSYETEIKYLDSENEQLKKRINNLVSENTRLQNELFSEHLKQVETEDFIDKLKRELKEYRGF